MGYQISKMLSTGGGLEIPISTGVIDPGKQQLVFTVGLVAGPSGMPVPYFKERDKAAPAQPNDGPLDLRIPRKYDTYLIVFNLDKGAYDCDFRPYDAVTVMDKPSTIRGRYYGLTASDPVDYRYRQVRFNAKFFDEDKANYDAYNLYLRFHFDRVPSDKEQPPPMTVRYDPDIKNPGDYGW